ncbi:hypothetical protein [Nocardia sp. BMG51109]|uniref:SHOCT domain-containing protein n=1 Tax=Nocardia sp. BMG51109 TaxID=1056816 RepID=UPI000563A2AD
MFWYSHDMNGWGYAWMGIGVLFWGLLIAGLIMLVRYVAATERGAQYRIDPRSPEPTAERLLAERFARGEVDEKEYASRLVALRNAEGDR